MLFLILLFPICLITSVNPVVSVLCLVGLAALLAVYWFLTGLTFISMLYVLVYVGAVAILFLFVIMTLDVRELELVNSSNWSKHLPLAMLVTAIFVFSIIHNSSFLVASVSTQDLLWLIEFNNIQVVGLSLYGYNSFQLILIVLVLLSAIIIPLYICLKKQSSANY